MSSFLLGSSTAHSSVLARLLAKGAPESVMFISTILCICAVLYASLHFVPINNPVESQRGPTWPVGQGIYVPEIAQEARTVPRSKPMSKFPLGRQGGLRATFLSVVAADLWQILLQKSPGWVLWSWSLGWGKAGKEKKEVWFGPWSQRTMWGEMVPRREERLSLNTRITHFRAGEGLWWLYNPIALMFWKAKRNKTKWQLREVEGFKSQSWFVAKQYESLVFLMPLQMRFCFIFLPCIRLTLLNLPPAVESLWIFDSFVFLKAVLIKTSLIEIRTVIKANLSLCLLIYPPHCPFCDLWLDRRSGAQRVLEGGAHFI